MKNQIKALAITNTVLLVGLIIFILVVKPTTESGEKVSYIPSKDDEPAVTE